MKAKIKNQAGKPGKEIKFPKQFEEEIRPDLIKRAVFAIQSHNYQPYGASPEAGKRHSAELSRRRRKYRGAYGMGISRVPRKILSRRGTRMNWVGALAPGTVGGRRAHPPKSEKNIEHKINVKERRKAIRSALSASIQKELVEKRGHIINDYPLVVEEKAEKIEKTKDALSMLEKIGLKEDLQRAQIKKIRAGKGKMRGRKYKKKKGPLVVVSKDCELVKAAKNIPGVDVVVVDKVNAELLAPGADAGRATVYTDAALKRLTDEKLFTDNLVKKIKPAEEKK
ncbi:50S ribosomal protein L4 [Candidatus Woesearchaeota archaeon]|nr:50S ribosomal protein L4 [Candidatus Woesearchaeota archaeon]